MIAASISGINNNATEAYLSGKKPSDNPYPIDSAAYREWAVAFLRAAFEAECA